jgi:hypothetical protein
VSEGRIADTGDRECGSPQHFQGLMILCDIRNCSVNIGRIPPCDLRALWKWLNHNRCGLCSPESVPNRCQIKVRAVEIIIDGVNDRLYARLGGVDSGGDLG